MEVEQLLSAIKNYNIIYDLSNKDYKNIRKRDAAFDAVAKEIGVADSKLHFHHYEIILV